MSGRMMKNHFGKVQMKKLEPMRIACLRATGATPENDSIRQMKEWLARQGLGGPARMFGFDVDVTPEQRRAGLRGYEVWAVVPESVKASGAVTIKDFAGGLYAVMRISDPFTNPFEVIPTGWRMLVGWAKTNEEYEIAENACLEEHIEDKGTFLDIYLPLAKRRNRKKTRTVA